MSGRASTINDAVTFRARRPQAEGTPREARKKKRPKSRAKRATSSAIYALAPPRGDLHRAALACVACCLTEVPALASDARRAERRLARKRRASWTYIFAHANIFVLAPGRARRYIHFGE
jgi:hypothetical protein